MTVNEFKDRLTGRSLTLSKSLCMLAAAIPLLAAAGWIFKIELLTKIHPALPAMQPNTALALVLSAIAITFTGDNRRSGKGRLVACAIAAVVSFLGLLTLGEYIFSWNLGIDRIFISDTAGAAGRLYPGRLSPQTAANLALLGAALLIYNSRALSIRIGQVCALVVGANAIVAMTGYIFSTSQFYGFPSITRDIGMAIHTAGSFILLALALLCSRPNDGMMSLVTSDTRSGSIARRILLVGILAPPVVGALTRVGVYANWYDVSVQVSLFAVVIVALVLRTTWRAARQSEQHELRARAAFDETQVANKRLQKALDERRIFEALIENSSDFIGIADPTGKPVYVNPAGRRMVGLPDDYPVEDTQILEYYPPDQRAFASDVILRSMVEHGHWQGETNFRHWQKQEAVPVSDEHFMIRDPGGRLLGMGTVTRDISDVRRSQTQLRQSEERLALALRGADLGSWDWNIKTGEVIFSPRWAEMRGFRPEEIKPHVDSWSSGVHPDDWPHVQKMLTNYFQGLVPEYEVEFRVLTKSGDWIWMLDRGKVFARDEKGDPLRMVGTELDITERKRAEDALQRSEREFRELAEAMPQIVWATTADGLNIYFNRQWVDYTGLTLEESYGEGWITPFHPDDRQRAWDAWQGATKHRDTYSLECRLRRADGVYQWWLIRGVPLLNANGEISKWFGTCTDIEQIKIAEQRLKESEAKFSGIISISADAIISIDAEQRITIFNNGAEQIFGYSQAEAIGTPLDNLIPERFRKTHRQHVERFASEAVTARRMGERLTTITGLRKNGEEFPAEAAISKLQVGDKTLLTVALRDITERKRFEKEQQFLAEAAAVLATSLDYEQTLATVAHLVARDFADWCMVEVVDEHQQILRLKVVGRDPSKADVCAFLERIRIDRDRPYLLRAVLETKQALLIEHVTSEHLESFAQGPEHLQALRAMNPTSVMALPLLRHERVLGALAFISSTASRHYGRVDLRLAEALAERAAVAIENARLYRASVNATELRDQVLGVVAHDLRNPLSTILMQASVVKSHGPQPERRSQKPMEVIERAARRMNRLIQDLLDVALMEAGQLTIKQAQLSASRLIVEVVDMQRPLASSSSVELRVEVDPDIPDVSADRDRLLQVFENLIGNAIKFTRAGGHITAGATSKDDEVVFWVADTGCGIASENLPHVFDPFWQATKAGRQGAGLGLPITKGIVEAHGGRIWVESTAGGGSTFFFTIPRVSAAQDRLSDHHRPDRAA